MAKLTLDDLSSLTNQTSAVTKINNNNTAVEAAIEKTLSRDGTSPNNMTSELDMDSNHIINLPAPAQVDEPVRVQDLADYLTLTDLVTTTASANTVLSGPTTGSAALPAFRALTGADLPNPGTSTKGGVKAVVPVNGSFVWYIDTNGTPQLGSVASFAPYIGAALGPPKINVYVNAGRNILAPTAGATLMLVELIGGGGGGCGNNSTNTIPNSQRGGRGGFSCWDVNDPKTVTINIGTNTFTCTAHGLAADQPIYFTTTGALPTGLTADDGTMNTIYYVRSTGLTANTFQVATTRNTLFPAGEPDSITLSGTQSGVHSMTSYMFVAGGGSGGGVIGDQGLPGASIGLDFTDLHGIPYQSWHYMSGATGGGVYGHNVGSGEGGNSPEGGGAGSGFSTNGNPASGGGGAGASATLTSSGGTGGAGGSKGVIWLKPTKATYKYIVGASGEAGTPWSMPTTVNIGTSTFTGTMTGYTSHNFVGGEPVQFSVSAGGTLPTGIAADTTYYVDMATVTTDTFKVSDSYGGTTISLSGSLVGTLSCNHGYLAGLGGSGCVRTTEFFGLI